MKIGLSADELITLGIAKYQETLSQVFENIANDSDIDWLHKGNPELIQKASIGEAVIRAVATMIELNNAALQADLEKLEAFRDQ